MACLKSSGNMPLDNERLISVGEIGCKQSGLRQDFRRQVGMDSKEQVGIGSREYSIADFIKGCTSEGSLEGIRRSFRRNVR